MADQSVECAWTHYWQSDRLASCGGAGERQYQIAIVRHWHRVFARLETPPRLLDLCCGNGALAILAGRYYLERRGIAAAIDAVDRARIDPERWLTQQRTWIRQIRFHGAMAAESLTFPNATFTAIIGQYALEYTDIDRTLAECVRVLTPDGQLAFVIHAREGCVVARALAQQAEIATIRALDYFSLAQKLAQAIASGSGDTALKLAFEARCDALRALETRSLEPGMYQNILGVIQHALAHLSDCPLALVRDKITEVEQGLNYHALRTEALARAARTADEIRQQLSPLGRLGFRPLGEWPEAIEGEGGLIGWSAILTRARA